MYFRFLDKNVITVWSCPNYCYRCGNKASILQFDDKMNRNIKTFESVEDPNILNRSQ